MQSSVTLTFSWPGPPTTPHMFSSTLGLVFDSVEYSSEKALFKTKDPALLEIVTILK